MCFCNWITLLYAVINSRNQLYINLKTKNKKKRMVALGVFPQLSAGGPWGGRGSRGFSAVSGGWCCSVRPSPGACSAQWRGLPTVPPRPLFFAGSPVSWFHSSFGQVFRHYIKKAFHAVGHRTPILRAWNKSASLTVEDSFLEGPVYRPGVRPPCA